MSRDSLEVTGPLGRIVLGSRALATVVRRAAESVEGVRVRRSRRDVLVEVDGRLHVVLAISTGLAVPLPEAGEHVQHAVVGALAPMTGRDVTVDVTIEAVSAP